MKTIIIADDHSFTLQGTKSFVESIGFRVLETCNNGISAFNLIKVHLPNIAILDINMPGLDGLEILQKIHEQKINIKIILLTMHRDKSVYNKALEYGVFGYILKEQADIELEKCLKAIDSDKKYVNLDLDSELIFHTNSAKNHTKELSVSEKKILELVAQQKSSQQIAELLFISKKTVEGHRRNIIEKLGLPKEKYALLIWAIQNVK
ncbi:MAG: response regulator transcription factor [Flavobacterium sp.]|uniref:response regulator n=1 Tax=Flavobacterium sp. TaxID=239 RepID=UPI0026200864|nr:response regulator transcription factor [Flavobacterium sp.]MDD5151000.1 response regulator transcription factor [Flavobacterium sp.]